MSKKLLTKILAFTMCAGLVLQPATAFAQEGEPETVETEDAVLTESEPAILQSIMHEWIAKLNLSSDYDTIPVLSGEVTSPYFGMNGEYVVNVSSSWQQAVGDSWGFFEFDNFIPGTYRCVADVEVPEGYTERFWMNGNTALYVNGKEWTLIGSRYPYENTKRPVLTFASEEIIVEDESPTPVEKTEVTSAELAMIPWLGELNPVYNTPCDQWIEFFSEDPIVVASLYCWQERNFGEGDKAWRNCWPKYYEAKEYRYCVALEIADDYKDEYILSENPELTVDGKSMLWIDAEYDENHEIQKVIFASEVYNCSNVPVIIEEKVSITSAKADSDYNTIAKYGEPIKTPSFELEEDTPVSLEGYWFRTVDGVKWELCEKGLFIPGTYYCGAIVSIDSETPELYELDPDFKLYINGKEWTWTDSNVTEEGQLAFISEEIKITASDPEEPEDPEDPEDPEEPIEDEGQWHEKYGAKYYELPDGKKATGIQKIGEDSYLFSENGTLQKDVFYEEDGNKYYFGSDGKMVKGWFDKWSARYYTNEDGVVQTGFVDIEGNTYYFDAKGKKAASLWVNEDGKRFYIKADGRMAKGEKIHRWGKEYTFAEDGALIK